MSAALEGLLHVFGTVGKLFGATGMNAVSRIMGFMLICIGVQFVINGVLEIADGFSSSQLKPGACPSNHESTAVAPQRLFFAILAVVGRNSFRQSSLPG